MKHVAIATLVSGNLGNRLQNYALQQAIKRCAHCRVETLLPRYMTWGARAKEHVKGLVSPLFPQKRWACFTRFDAKFVRYAPSRICDEGIGDCFDGFVIGSDQVWNPTFSFVGEYEYLPQVASEKKMAYAASFGVAQFCGDVPRTAALLGDIPAISVREQAGAAIVRELCGRDVPVVLDPTMLLDARDWERVERAPGFSVPERYCLRYVLGDGVHDEQIASFARARGLAVVDALGSGGAIGPSEFVWLVHHAELICTDSFHGSVFATLFEKPLAIFTRQSAEEDMSSRIDTLCDTFHIGQVRCASEDFDLERCFHIDWRDVEACLQNQRRQSEDYLQHALSAMGIPSKKRSILRKC